MQNQEKTKQLYFCCAVFWALSDPVLDPKTMNMRYRRIDQEYYSDACGSGESSFSFQKELPDQLFILDGGAAPHANKSTRKPNFGTFGPIVIYIWSRNIKKIDSNLENELIISNIPRYKCKINFRRLYNYFHWRSHRNDDGILFCNFVCCGNVFKSYF